MIVLLHGARLDHNSWLPQTRALAGRFRLVLPDLRGHGESTGRFGFDAAVDDILVLLERLPARRVVLVGLSLGANIAQEVVRRVPDRVRALVLADSACNTAYRLPWIVPLTISALIAQAAPTGGAFIRHAARLSSVNLHVQAYAIAADARRSTLEILNILLSLLTSALRPDPGYRLPVPALLVHGEDRVADFDSDVRSWVRRDPSTEYSVIPEAKHFE